MITNFSIISGAIPDNKKITKSSGIGRIVSVSPDELVLKAADKTISLKADDINLQTGDVVRYRISAEKIFVEKIVSGTPNRSKSDTVSFRDQSLKTLPGLIKTVIQELKQNDSISDQLESTLQSLNTLLKNVPLPPTDKQYLDQLLQTGDINKQKKELLQTLESIRSSLLNNLNIGDSKNLFEIPEQNIGEGYYLFNSQKDAQNFLQQHEININCPLLQGLGSSEPLVLKLVQNIDGIFGTFLNIDEFDRELLSLLFNFKSRTLQSISPEIIKMLLHQRTFIDTQILDSLDNTLSRGQLYLDSKRAGSESAQRAVITQWLNNALDNASILPEIVRLLPASAASIPHLVNQIANAKENGSIMQFPATISLTGNIAENANKKETIPALMENLGITLESSLSKSMTNHVHSLKANILKQLNLLFDSQVESFSKELQKMFYSFDSPDKSRYDQIPDTLKNVLMLTENMKDSFSELQRSVSQPYFKILEHLKEALTKFYNSLDTIVSDLKKSIDSQNNNFISTQNHSKPVFFTDLRSCFEDFKTEVVKAAQVASQVSPEVLPFQKNKPVEQSLQALLKSLDNITENNTTPARQYNSQNTAFEQNTIISEKDLENTQLTLFSKNHLKQNLETLLNRVESIQLLAKKSHTSDGEQQILAIPMSINGEWTELQIRMEKKGSKKTDHNQKQFSVYLDVSPSGLGSISAVIDYQKQKTFKVQIEFENKNTKSWFETNNNHFRSALNNLGLPSVQIVLKLQKKDQSGDHENNENIFSLIDIKI